MPIGAILGVGGALLQASSANRAANAQENAANRDLAFQTETRDMVFDRLDPWYQGGNLANQALMSEMGLGARPMVGGRQYGGFTASPGYQFQRDAGNDSINALAGARGGHNSGRTLQDLAKFNQGLASQEWGNHIARLSGLAGQGLGAATGQANAATNAASGVSNALSGLGNAQAAGAIGVGNAINGGIQNGLGMWQYQRAMNPQGGSASGAGGTLFNPFARQ